MTHDNPFESFLELREQVEAGRARLEVLFDEARERGATEQYDEFEAAIALHDEILGVFAQGEREVEELGHMTKETTLSVLGRVARLLTAKGMVDRARERKSPS